MKIPSVKPEHIFFHGVHESLRVFERYAGIHAVDHAQTAFGKREFFDFFTDERVNLCGRAVRRYASLQRYRYSVYIDH